MISEKIITKHSTYDAVICGAGIAGLTLARQLRLNYSNLKILVLDKARFPRPIATCKVGESTTEIGSFYLAEMLDLKDYFVNSHYTKLGFRFLLGPGEQKVEDRPEIGLTEFPPYNSYQVDRGILENDLYEFNRASDIEIVQGVTVQKIDITPEAEMNKVAFEISGQPIEIETKWVIDASGRRQLIQRELGLTKKTKPAHNAIWFRLEGRADLDDMVDNDNFEFKNKVPHKKRFFSTVHVMGAGYWVWIIPLSSGHTSIGIVASEDLHPFDSFNTKEAAANWFEKHEPVFGEYFTKFKMVDFLRMKNYTYSSEQIFSFDRWACTGEAALFADPLYAVGTNLIGYENICITHMIGLDLYKDQLTQKQVEDLDKFVISQNEWLIDSIQSSYPYFGHPQVYTLAFLWSVTVGWALDSPQMFNSTYLNKELKERLTIETAKIISALGAMKQLFLDWHSCARNTFSFKYLNYLDISFIRKIYVDNLKPNKSTEELIQDRINSVMILEGFAQVLFRLVVKDALPEEYERLETHSWLNISAISLNPEQWEKAGLFKPTTEPRDISAMIKEIEEIFESTDDEIEVNVFESDLFEF